MLKNKIQILLSSIFIGVLVWWISFQKDVLHYGPSVQWFDSTYGIMALIGAIIGFIAARKWGGRKTVLGKALLLLSFGLLAQEAGQLIYFYYVQIDKIQIPFPSWGDAAYFGSTLLYISGALYLAEAAGSKLALKNIKYKVIALVIPVAILAVSYAILMHGFKYGHSNFLAIFLDNGYPIGEAVYISIAIVAFLLSAKLLGGIMKSGILLLILALAVQYSADFLFVYQSNRGEWYSGNYNDFSYFIAYYVMSLALLNFFLIYKGLMKKKTKDQNMPEKTASNQEILNAGQ